VPVPEAEVAFHRDVRLPVLHELRAMGVDSALEHISSPWAGLNDLSLAPSTVLVHDQQVPLIRKISLSRSLRTVSSIS